MRELMAHSVEVWESDPEAFSYHPVGYMQISPEVMHEDVACIARQQQEIGYTSVFIEGEAECLTYMQGLFDDWQARGITSVLHEKKGGYANNSGSMHGLAAKARGEGVRILPGVRGHGLPLRGTAPSRPSRPIRARSRPTTSSSASGPGSSLWDHARLAARIGIHGREAGCTRTCRCGRTGACRKGRSESTPSSACPTMAACRP